MTLTVEAIYENGVLKPTQPLPLKSDLGRPGGSGYNQLRRTHPSRNTAHGDHRGSHP